MQTLMENWPVSGPNTFFLIAVGGIAVAAIVMGRRDNAARIRNYNPVEADYDPPSPSAGPKYDAMGQ